MTITISQPAVYTGPIWYAPSSTSGKFYLVGLDATDFCKCGQRVPALYHCECPDHVHRARDCKHIRAVVAGAVKMARRKGERVVVPVVVLPHECGLYADDEWDCRACQAVAA